MVILRTLFSVITFSLMSSSTFAKDNCSEFIRPKILKACEDYCKDSIKDAYWSDGEIGVSDDGKTGTVAFSYICAKNEKRYIGLVKYSYDGKCTASMPTISSTSQIPTDPIPFSKEILEQKFKFGEIDIVIKSIATKELELTPKPPESERLFDYSVSVDTFRGKNKISSLKGLMLYERRYPTIALKPIEPFIEPFLFGLELENGEIDARVIIITKSGQIFNLPYSADIYKDNRYYYFVRAEGSILGDEKVRLDLKKGISTLYDFQFPPNPSRAKAWEVLQKKWGPALDHQIYNDSTGNSLTVKELIKKTTKSK